MNGIELIAAERTRQVEVEGWTQEHDVEHEDGCLATVAALYAIPPEARLARCGPIKIDMVGLLWPQTWDEFWWKPSALDRIKELTKAGALIAAEIDRLQAQPGGSGDE